ncbi:hypothetical protein [Fibrella rubiginis]|nr:hypothetical protein [Fibrella rubiginis]
MKAEKVKATILETHWGIKIKVVTVYRIRRVTREGSDAKSK